MGLNFLKISQAELKKGELTIYPKFKVGRHCDDLMIRGRDFYAVWDEANGKWSTDEDRVIQLVDQEVRAYADQVPEGMFNRVHVKYMWDSDSGIIDKWHKYCQKQMRDNFHQLDDKIIFANDPVSKEDYSSKRLEYAIEEGSTKNWDRLLSVLYSEEEARKIKWAIGAIVTGDSKRIEKFLVLYGSAGTGKGTVLKVIKMLFGEYSNAFSAKALGQMSNEFALEPFSSNPLVAIDWDAKLDRIEDNTRLNTIVSHEDMTVNEKFKTQYTTHFNSFLFIASNNAVRITDAKSGLLRRLIDVNPSGNLLTQTEYDRVMKNIQFELGAIAYSCRELYLEDPGYYDSYRPEKMLSTTNDFYNFILDTAHIFEDQDSTTLKQAWTLYKDYCTDANISYPFSRIRFKDELKNYFNSFYDRTSVDGKQLWNYYDGFVYKKGNVEEDSYTAWLKFDCNMSLLDDILSDCPAQYANKAGNPRREWDHVRVKLKDIDTKKLHYVRVPLEHIVIDFDIPDENGEKSLEKNLEAASKFPPTYAELSKSGKGIHLHYIYSGDPLKLSSVYDEHIEVKVFNGKSSLRRQLTRCNDISITTISSGLEMKGDKNVNIKDIEDERHLKNLIRKALRKEINGCEYTTPAMNFIKHITDEAYDSGMHFDVHDMRESILSFAAESSNQRDYCIGLLNEMHWFSDDVANADPEEPNIIFYDVEVFPNLFIVNWKFPGENNPVNRMINPTPFDIENLLEYDWVGFNCRKYDNHMMYARLQGYSNEKLYELSQRIIVKKDRQAFFPSAYGMSYTDIYDYCAKKQSLKKWEIELGIHHQELGLPWDEPVPENLWSKVAEYCDNDVLATEAVWNATQGDFTARKILAALAGGSVNDTTNKLTAKLIFGDDKEPQSKFNYRNMGDVSKIETHITEIVDAKGRVWPVDPEYNCKDGNGMPIFPGYIFENGKSTYRDELVGEGGYVYSEPGIHGMVPTIDVRSEHPFSARNEVLLGIYQKMWDDLVDARGCIKHGDFDAARKMFDGRLEPFLKDETVGNQLAQALKIAANSIYGLTSAKFDNLFKDPRNKDNIVAKRGALFMINLKHEVQDKGFKVAHIKTDSIKIPDATPEIIDFVMAYGALYGYEFEHESTYERMLLADKANFIAYYASKQTCLDLYGYVPDKNKKKAETWTATGDKYARPFIFKPLFSGEELMFDDMSETKAVQKGAIYLDFNENMVDVTAEEKELKKWATKYRKGEINDTTFKNESDRLNEIIAKGHNYTFVGRVGNFVPIKEGCHGGLCMRLNEAGNYGAVEGTKGYRWMEAEFVKENGLEDNIDMGYFKAQADKVIDESVILPGGDFEWFRNVDDPYILPEYDENGIPIYKDEVPWSE